MSTVLGKEQYNRVCTCSINCTDCPRLIGFFENPVFSLQRHSNVKLFAPFYCILMSFSLIYFLALGHYSISLTSWAPFVWAFPFFLSFSFSSFLHLMLLRLKNEGEKGAPWENGLKPIKHPKIQVN